PTEACQRVQNLWRVYHYQSSHFIGDDRYGYRELNDCLDAQYGGRKVGGRWLICAAYGHGSAIFDANTGFRYGFGVWFNVADCNYSLRYARGGYLCATNNSRVSLVHADKNQFIYHYPSVQDCVRDLY